MKQDHRSIRRIIVGALAVILASTAVLIAWRAVKMNHSTTQADFYVSPAGSDELMLSGAVQELLFPLKPTVTS